MIEKIKSWFIATKVSSSAAIIFTAMLVVTVAASAVACSLPVIPAENPDQVSGLTPPLEPTAMVISNFTVNPAKVNLGDSVSIVANVTNTSGSEGLYNADLRINNANVASKALIIPGGATQTLNFKVPTNSAGIYEVAFGGLKGTFSVVDYAVTQVKPVQLNNNTNSNAAAGAASTSSCCSPTQPAANGSSAGGCCGTPSPAPSTSISPKKASGGCCGL